MKVVFFGGGKYVLPVLEKLAEKFEVLLVLTTEKSEKDPVSSFAKKEGIECLRIKKFDENLKSYILNLKSPVAVLANFGLIIPEKVINFFPKGIINIHPSLLPEYRGPSPAQAAILNGDEITGVSIIKLDKWVDHGPILAQDQERIKDDDTAESLYVRLFEKGAKLLVSVLGDYLEGKIEPLPQKGKPSFTKMLKREDGRLDILKLKRRTELEIRNWKLELARKVRAFHPWPGVWFRARLRGKEKIIKLLPEERIQVEGKKPMSYKDFINGYSEGWTILKNLGLRKM